MGEFLYTLFLYHLGAGHKLTYGEVEDKDFAHNRLEAWLLECWTRGQYDVGIFSEYSAVHEDLGLFRDQGPLHTRAKNCDHEIVQTSDNLLSGQLFS